MRHGRSIGKRGTRERRRSLRRGCDAVARKMSPRQGRAVGIAGSVIALVHVYRPIAESRKGSALDAHLQGVCRLRLSSGSSRTQHSNVAKSIPRKPCSGKQEESVGDLAFGVPHSFLESATGASIAVTNRSVRQFRSCSPLVLKYKVGRHSAPSPRTASSDKVLIGTAGADHCRFLASLGMTMLRGSGKNRRAFGLPT